MKEAIISIGGGKMQLSLIDSIKKKDYAVIVIDRDNNCPGKYESDYFINISTYDYDNIIDELEKIMDRFIFKAVMVKSSGKPVLTAAKIAERFGLEFASVKASELTLNKTMLMNKMKQEGILCPKSFDMNNLNFPVIIKPKGGTGGKKNIFKIKDINELVNIKKKCYFVQEDYEIQEYIEGNDCVFFAAIKDKKIKYYTIIDELNNFEMNKEKTFNVRGLGFSIPSIYVNTDLENVIFNTSKKIIDILQINTAIIWISYRVNNKKPYLIEIHLDLAGEYILDRLMGHYTGIDCVKEVIDLYVDRESFNIKKDSARFMIIFDKDLINYMSNEYDIVEIGEHKGSTNFIILK